MCPDIEVYAPLVAAAFGLGSVDGVAAGHPAHRMRVRLADRALTQTNPCSPPSPGCWTSPTRA